MGAVHVTRCIGVVGIDAGGLKSQPNLLVAVIAIRCPFPGGVHHPGLAASELGAMRMRVRFSLDMLFHQSFAFISNVRQTQLPALRAAQVIAQLGHEACHTHIPRAIDHFTDQPFSLKSFHAQHQVHVSRCSPVQAQAVIVPMTAKKRAVEQRALYKIVCMRMLLVQVADL